jgi:hypothetical protein
MSMPSRGRSNSNPSQLRSTAGNLHSHGDAVASTSHSSAPLGSGSLGPLASGTEGTINSHLGALPGHVSTMADRVHRGGSNIEGNAANIEANEDHVASSFRAIGSGTRAPSGSSRPVQQVAPGGAYYVTGPDGKRRRVNPPGEDPESPPTSPSHAAPTGPPPPGVTLTHPGLNQGTPLPGSVYRTDTRPPGEIFQNGFTSHGNDYNLWKHQTGGQYLNDTGYISTTQNPAKANQFLKPAMSGPGLIQHEGVNYLPRQGQIYHIDPTGNLVHLPSQQMTGNLQDTFSAQEEWAAVHHIDPQNIQGVSTHSGYFSIGGSTTVPANSPHPGNPAPIYQSNPGYVPGHQGYNPYNDPASGFHNGIPNITDRPADTYESDSDNESESGSEAGSQHSGGGHP